MRRINSVCFLVLGIMLGWNFAYAGDFYVIPVKKKDYAPVQKTGQTDSYVSGDDGYYQKGVGSPDPRFTDNGNGTVTDNMTGLIWMKNAGCTEFYLNDTTGKNQRYWNNAVTAANKLSAGYCGLTDGSSNGDWRLPNIKELQSLIDFSYAFPAIKDNPFTNCSGADYWSSTTDISASEFGYWAWQLDIFGGYIISSLKDSTELWVWCVRGGQ